MKILETEITVNEGTLRVRVPRPDYVWLSYITVRRSNS